MKKFSRVLPYKKLRIIGNQFLKFLRVLPKKLKIIKNQFLKFFSIEKFQILTGTALIASLGLFIYFGVYNLCWLYHFLGIETKKEVIEFIGIGIAGLIGLFNVLAVLKRVKAQENMAKAQFENNEAQHDSNEQKAFNDAIINLGSDKESVRLGGIYNLYEMAINKLPKARNISEILCAHVRNTTQKKDYQEEYSKKPSNEIQSLLDLFSKKEGGPFKKIPLDLSNTYLQGANLWFAQLQKTNLSQARLQGADLFRAQLQGAYLREAQLQGANLREAQLQGANLREAQLQGADLFRAQLQGANLIRARLQGAYLGETQLQGAYLWDAQLQEANLTRAQLQGNDLRYAQLQGAILSEAQLQGANLRNAQLQGADLYSAQLQGADLYSAQLQGANLREVQLQGTFTRYILFHPSVDFKQRIESRIGKNTELTTAIFAGGIIKEYIERFKKDLSPMVEKKFLKQGRLDFLLKKLEDHIGKKSECTLPENSKAITGILTNEMAEEIIKKYNKAMKL